MKPLIALTVAICISFQVSHGQTANSPCPANIVAKADDGKEGTNITFPDVTNATYTPASGSFFRLGSHSIIVTNGTGQKCSFTVTVTDNESPVLSPLTLSRQNLWPESNKMKKVSVWYDVSDNGENVTTSLTVSSNSTDGIKDSEVVDNHLVRLKTSRLPDGSPRIYNITVTAVDESGNKTTRTTTIAVSKTMTAVAGIQ